MINTYKFNNFIKTNAMLQSKDNSFTFFQIPIIDSLIYTNSILTNVVFTFFILYITF